MNSIITLLFILLCNASPLLCEKLLFIVYKQERVMEVWRGDRTLQLHETIPICQLSGDLGPKYHEGDLQVPEGFYHVARFNAKSLLLNYPNPIDRRRSDRPGGSIAIHGMCVSIGCVSFDDSVMAHVYALAVRARTGGQTKIPVYIFPARMEGLPATLPQIESAALREFWMNLKQGYDLFMHTRTPLRVSYRGDEYRFE